MAIVDFPEHTTAYDVARAVAFLASEYDGFIPGATIDISGGV